MQGFAILNLVKQAEDVELHFSRPPLLRDILATDPPKSSSLYVQTSLGKLLSLVMCKNKCSLGLMRHALSSKALT